MFCTVGGTKPFWSRLATLCWMIVYRRLWLVGQGQSHLYGFPLLGQVLKATRVVQVHSGLIECAGREVDSGDAQGRRHLDQRPHEQTPDAYAAREAFDADGDDGDSGVVPRSKFFAQKILNYAAPTGTPTRSATTPRSPCRVQSLQNRELGGS